MFSFFWISVVTPAISHSRIWSSLINMWKSVAKYFCFAVSCKTRSLLFGLFQEASNLLLLLVPFWTVQTWILLTLRGFFIMLCLFPIYFFPEVLYFLFGLWIFFGICQHEKVVEFLAVCSEHFISCVLTIIASLLLLFV